MSSEETTEHACDWCGVNVENGSGEYFEGDRLCSRCFGATREPDDGYAYLEFRARTEGLDAAELMGGREVEHE